VASREAAEDAFNRERCFAAGSAQRTAARGITLAFYDGHTYSQVASMLDVPLGTVKARIRDAMIKLRGCLLSEQ